MVLTRLRAALAATLGLASCLDPLAYPCDAITQCTVDGKDGTCHSSGWCVYPDDECPSGERFGPAAGDGLAGDCVVGGTNGGSGSASEASSAATNASESTTAACGDCSEPPGPCFAPDGACNGATGSCEHESLATGTSCDDDDLCTLEAECDADGECVPVQTVECDDPPSSCHATPGACDPVDGECVYEQLAAGDDCEDGDGCTMVDTCDSTGNCIAGPICESADPCQIGACTAGACMFADAADGVGCGANAADRCCAGVCTDISADAANCGGCGAVCQADETCESIAVTTQCSPHPEATTGRCTCNGENADCPHGQICVTVAPVIDRCAPENAGDCPGGLFHDVPSCPNYCEYGD